MPRHALYYVRAAMVWLLVGGITGVLAATYKAWPVEPIFWRLLALHREAMLVGWTTQIILGVGLWIFPRYLDPAEKTPEAPAWVGWVLLNAGLASAGLARGLGAPVWVVVAGHAVEVVGVLAALLHAWRRVRPLRVGRGRER